MFPPKKDKGVGVMIAVGKPKPPALDEPGKKPMPSAPQHEADESPDEESSEEYGAKLLNDMLKPIIDAGAEEGHAKEILASIFDAAAACLRAEHSPVAEHDAGGMPMEGDEEGYGR